MNVADPNSGSNPDPDPYRTPSEVPEAKRGLLKSPLAWVLIAAGIAVVALGFLGFSRSVANFGEYRGGPPRPVVDDAYVGDVYDADVYEAELSADERR